MALLSVKQVLAIVALAVLPPALCGWVYPAPGSSGKGAPTARCAGDKIASAMGVIA
jgi:hypothetical protein